VSEPILGCYSDGNVELSFGLLCMRWVAMPNSNTAPQRSCTRYRTERATEALASRLVARQFHSLVFNSVCKSRYHDPKTNSSKFEKVVAYVC